MGQHMWTGRDYLQVVGKMVPPPATSGYGVIMLGKACKRIVDNIPYDPYSPTSFFSVENGRTFRKLYKRELHMQTAYSPWCDQKGYYVDSHGRAFKDTRNPGLDYKLAAPFVVTAIEEDYDPNIEQLINQVAGVFSNHTSTCRAAAVVIIDPNMRLRSEEFPHAELVQNEQQLLGIKTLSATLGDLQYIFNTRMAMDPGTPYVRVGIISVGDTGAIMASAFANGHKHAVATVPGLNQSRFYLIGRGEQNYVNFVWLSTTVEQVESAAAWMLGEDRTLACIHTLVLVNRQFFERKCESVTNTSDFCKHTGIRMIDLQTSFVDLMNSYFESMRPPNETVIVYDGGVGRRVDARLCGFSATPYNVQQVIYTNDPRTGMPFSNTEVLPAPPPNTPPANDQQPTNELVPSVIDRTDEPSVNSQEDMLRAEIQALRDAVADEEHFDKTGETDVILHTAEQPTKQDDTNDSPPVNDICTFDKLVVDVLDKPTPIANDEPKAEQRPEQPKPIEDAPVDSPQKPRRKKRRAYPDVEHPKKRSNIVPHTYNLRRRKSVAYSK